MSTKYSCKHFPVCPVVKNLPCNVGDTVRSLVRELRFHTLFSLYATTKTQNIPWPQLRKYFGKSVPRLIIFII